MLGSRVSRPRQPSTALRRGSSATISQSKPIVHRAAPVARPLTVSTRRPLLLLICIVILAGGLIARLTFWQVMQHARLSAAVHAERQGLLVQPAMRGQIFDANGNPLATDVTMAQVYADPAIIKDPHAAAFALAPILKQSPSDLEKVLSGDLKYRQLAASVPQDVSNRIKQLHLSGIFLTPVIARTYPWESFASQVLGYTDTDNNGNYGLEQYYNNLLSGQTGLRSVLRDTAGNDVHLSTAPATPAHAGANLYLTLDNFIQSAAETELTKAVRKHHAKGGTVIVMNPRTGYILAMASTPTFNPNHYSQWGADPTRYRNPAVSDLYEPGSTFKVVTMAAGLDTHVITPNTAFDDTGVWTIDGIALHNWNLLGFGMETMTQVLQHSANVGASFVSSKLGSANFYRYVRAFGIGRPTGIDLAGEEQGELPLPGEKTWTPVNQFTNSFGQGLATTPMQMIHAVAAVANGGVLMKPQMVQRVVYDGRVFDRPPVSQGRVVSVHTARTLTHMLVESAIGGEASLGLVKGYDIAAKTGTSNIAGPNGGYLQGMGTTVTSIVGYAPASHPRYVILVKIDQPKDTLWGSVAAAPVLHDLFQDLFMYAHIPPSPHALNQ